MISFITILFVVAALYYIVILFASYFIYGKFLSDNEIKAALDRVKPKRSGINSLDKVSHMIYCEIGYIASTQNLRFHKLLLWRWSIDDVGVIPIWSKWNREIDKLWDELPPSASSVYKNLFG